MTWDGIYKIDENNVKYWRNIKNEEKEKVWNKKCWKIKMLNLCTSVWWDNKRWS